MARLAALEFLLAIFTVHVFANTGVMAQDGQIMLGSISNNSFGPGSFSIGAPGTSGPQSPPSNSNAGRPTVQQGASQQGNQSPPQSGSIGGFFYNGEGIQSEDGRIKLGSFSNNIFGDGSFSIGAPGRSGPQSPPSNANAGRPVVQQGASQQGNQRPQTEGMVSDDGRIRLGSVTNSTFGDGSFSIGAAGSSGPQSPNAGRPAVQQGGNNSQQGNQRPPQRGGDGGHNNNGGTGVTAENGQIGVGHISGNSFGDGSFSIGAPGSSDPQSPPYNANTGRPAIQQGVNNGQQGVSFSSTPPQRPQTNTQGGKGGEGGKVEGQIIIGMNSPPKGKPSIQIGSISGGSVPPGFSGITLNPAGFNTPNKPAFNNGNNQQQFAESQQAINNGYPTAGNQQAFSIGHSGNNHGNTEHANEGNRPVDSSQHGGYNGYTYPKPNYQQDFSAGHGTNGYGNNNAGTGYAQSHSGYSDDSESDEKPWVWGN